MSPACPIASLPMYDRPELRWATDQLWGYVASALTRAGVPNVPANLSREGPHEARWSDPRLLMSQTCGYDVHFRFSGRLMPLAAPVYRAAGCEGPTYRSALVVRSGDRSERVEDLAGRVAAYNEPASHSGRVALEAVVAEYADGGRFFACTRVTGSHERSAEDVAEGRADVAALDCTSFALLRRARPELAARLRILTFSPACPAPPFVVGPMVSQDIRDELAKTFREVATTDELTAVREALLLEALVPVEPSDYAAIGLLAESAARCGYDLVSDND